MATVVKSMSVQGIDGFQIEVEATTIKGQQQMISIIGLGDQAVKEAGERMQALPGVVTFFASATASLKCSTR